MSRIGTLKRLLPIAIEELSSHGELDSCIMAQTVVDGALEQVGIGDASPLTVKPKVMNPPLSTAFEESGMQLDEIMDLDWEERGYAMASFGESDDPEEGWPAHLITVIPNTFEDRPAILDLAIVRVNQKGNGFELSPILVGAPDGFLEGERSAKVNVNGCCVLYHAFPEDKSYKETKLWNDRDKQKAISDSIVNRM